MQRAKRVDRGELLGYNAPVNHYKGLPVPRTDQLFADYLNKPAGVLQLLYDTSAEAKRDLREALRHFPSVAHHLCDIFVRHGYDRSRFLRVLGEVGQAYPQMKRIDEIAAFVRSMAEKSQVDLIEAQMQEIVRLVREALRPSSAAPKDGMIDSQQRKDARRTKS